MGHGLCIVYKIMVKSDERFFTSTNALTSFHNGIRCLWLKLNIYFCHNQSSQFTALTYHAMRLIFVSRFSAVWLINEQVCIAACDCGRIDLAQVSYLDCLSVSLINFKQNTFQELFI